MSNFLRPYTELADKRLEELLSGKGAPELLWDSMAYSVRAGGKRLRPAMCMMAAEVVGGSAENVIDIACAFEMIHTYSLIHDDLPAMDNDVLRRGKPTNHVVFGEAQAILAGDGLLSYAFEVLFADILAHPDDMRTRTAAAAAVARAAGVDGMLAGQVVDVDKEGSEISEEELHYIHEHKTAAMIIGSLVAGAKASGASEEQISALATYGADIGLVFQMIDDVLDITGTDELGKSRGKDARDGKLTFPVMYGIEGTLKRAADTTEHAKAALGIFGEKAENLKKLADMLLARKK